MSNVFSQRRAFVPSAAGGADRPLLSILATLVCIGVVGLLFRDIAFPRLAIAGAIALFSAALFEAATALILFATWRDATTSRSTFVLALSFAIGAFLSGLSLLVLRMLPGEPPALPAAPQAGAWLYISWNISAAIGALAYVAFRHETKLPSRRFTLAVICFALLIAGGSVAVAFVFSDRLPALIAGTSLAGIVSSGLGPLALAALALTALLAFRIREPSKIDVALALSLVALAVEVLLILVSHRRYTVATYSAHCSFLLASSFVLASAIQTLLASHRRVRNIESAISQVESESTKRDGRIRALLQITAVESDERRFAAILQIATAAIRPGKVMLGLLSHRDGETIVVDATSWTLKEEAGAIAHVVYAGATFPFERTLQSLLCEERTQAWDDLGFVKERGMLCDDL